jgi:hypothetical protein
MRWRERISQTSKKQVMKVDLCWAFDSAEGETWPCRIAKFVDGGWMDGWMDGCAAHYCMQLSPDMKTAVRNSVHAPKMCDLSFSHGLYVQGAGHAQQRTADLSRQCNVPAVHVCMRLFVCLFSSLSILVCLSMCVAVRLSLPVNMYVWVCLRIEVRNRLDLAARFFHCAGTYLSEDCNMGILDPTAGNAHKSDIATPSPESNFVL